MTVLETSAPVFHSKIFSRIADITPEDWNRLYPEIPENYNFLKTLDESGLDPFEFYYIAVYSGEELVGVAPCFLMRYPLDTTVQGPVKKIILFLKKFFPYWFELKAVVCGLPMGQGRFGVTENSAKVLAAMEGALESFAASKHVSVVAFKDFGEEECEWLDWLQTKGYYKFESLPSTEMEISFRSFDEYLKGLSSTSRYDLKRKFKKMGKEAAVDMEIKSRLGKEELDRIYDLYLQTVHCHTEISFEVMTQDFFDRIQDNMPDESRYFLWRLHGRIVAFSLCLVSESRLTNYYVGFDYSLAYDFHLFFLHVCDQIKWCIQNKMTKYEMGNTSYEPKRRLGFSFIRLFVYAKHRSPAFNPLIHLLCKLLKPENFDEVFKIIRTNGKISTHA